MSIESILTALEETAFATAIVEGNYLFPWIESVHVLAVVTVVGVISIVDLRLLGVGAHVRSVKRLMQQLLPLTWGAFVVAVGSGFLMFASKAVKYFENVPFRVKMLLLLAAGINMLVFHLVTQRDIDKWDDGDVPRAAKIAGAISLTLWVLVIGFGRWIGFTVM